MNDNEIDWLRAALKACMSGGRGWLYGDEAPEGGFASAKDVAEHLAGTVSQTAVRAPGEHNLHLWAVHVPCPENAERSLIVANTGNGPRSEAHARLLAAAPGFLTRLLEERERLLANLNSAADSIAAAANTIDSISASRTAADRIHDRWVAALERIDVQAQEGMSSAASLTACIRRELDTLRAGGGTESSGWTERDEWRARLEAAQARIAELEGTVARLSEVATQYSLMVASPEKLNALADEMRTSRVRLGLTPGWESVPLPGPLATRERVIASIYSRGHRLAIVGYRFPGGELEPYVEASETHADSGPVHVIPLSEAVHLLQNVTAGELFSIGNRETDGDGTRARIDAIDRASYEAERRVGFVAKKRPEGPCGSFVGGVDALPHVCQVCEWSRDEHGGRDGR